MTEPPMPASVFDAISREAALEALAPVCASPRWLDTVVAGRPWSTAARVSEASDALIEKLAWDEIAQALSAHPRIGERPAGHDRESQWSRQEQSTASGASTDVSTALHDGNVAYEKHFGQVFLICATGRTPLQILEALTERLDNDEQTEQGVVRRELAAIVRLRLARILR